MQLHHEPVIDPVWEGEEIAADATHRYVWAWYGFNIRLFVIPRADVFGDEPCGADWRWCYPRNPEAVRASVAAWDPAIQDEPLGWHKRPGGDVRRAPRRDPADPYNAPRCEHGGYMDQGCTTAKVCHTTLQYRRAQEVAR